LLFIYHLLHWHRSLSDAGNKCVICHNTAQDDNHTTKKCLLLKKLVLQLEKRSVGANGNNSAVQVASNKPELAPSQAPSSSSPFDKGNGVGLLSVPGTCTASMEDATCDSDK
jgi:hypothetical protein